MLSTDNTYLVVAIIAAATLLNTVKPVQHAAKKAGHAVVHVATLGKK